MISRIRLSYTMAQLKQRWILLFITVGSEELCLKCDLPNIDVLRQAIIQLKRNLPNLFVVLVGPMHVSESSQRTYNLLKY